MCKGLVVLFYYSVWLGFIGVQDVGGEVGDEVGKVFVLG